MSSKDRFEVVKLEVLFEGLDLVVVARVVFTEVARPIIPALHCQISVEIYPEHELDHVDIADNLRVTPGEYRISK